MAQVEGSAYEWFLGDALGSVRQVVDDDGAVTLARDYSPFGVLRAEAGTGDSGYGFTGEQFAGYTQFVYLRARWMDPVSGRFISQDTWTGSIQQPATLHKYLYVLNRPVNLTDPSGLCPGADPECEALGKLSSTILKYARQLNQPVFTNMTDNGLAAMVAAKLLYEGELPGGSIRRSPLKRFLEWLREAIGICDEGLLVDPILERGTDRSAYNYGASYGVANVYSNQATQALQWARDLSSNIGRYGASVRDIQVETDYYRMQEWEQGPPPGVGPATWGLTAPYLPSARETLVSELMSNEGAIKLQTLVIVEQGWRIYEGASRNWGANEGTPTAEISAFRIAMGVFSDATDPSFWTMESGGDRGLTMSERWVGLMPRAAECLGTPLVPGVSYLPLSSGDRSRLTELGYSTALP